MEHVGQYIFGLVHIFVLSREKVSSTLFLTRIFSMEEAMGRVLPFCLSRFGFK